MPTKNSLRLLTLIPLCVFSLLFVMPQPSSSQGAASLAAAARARGFAATPERGRGYTENRAKWDNATTDESAFDEFLGSDPNDPNEIELDELEPEPLSTIELLMAGQGPNEVSTDLRQFGYDVFRRRVTTFAPITNVPVGSNYIVGPGDRFTVTMWGRHNDRIGVVIDREGKIALPEVGVLNVSGMSFGKLQDYLESELKRKYTDFRMHIAMGRLRTITVYTIGEAKAPGSYTLSSLSTAINALFAAGGPSRNGTLRSIRLLRNGQEPRAVDLYDFLLGGDKSVDVRLQDGDTIHIPLLGSVVGIAGNVKRPAIYEMRGALALGQALDLAGGVTYAGQLQHVQIERVENNRRRIVVDFDLSKPSQPGSNGEQRTEYTDGLTTLVQDGDLIKVFPVFDREENVVFLEGPFMQTGKYELKPGMRLRDILEYDMFQPGVNLEYAEIERLVPPDRHSVFLPFNLGKLLDGDETENLQLADSDTIRAFYWDEKGAKSVSISGMVYDPNNYRFVPGMRLTELLDAAGGLRKNAYLGKAELTRRHVSSVGMLTEKKSITLSNALAGDESHNVLLQDHDHLVIRPVPELDFGRTVEVLGEFRFPGAYPLRRGERLSSVIERAGGYTNRAYLRGAVFTRESARDVQRQRVNEMIRQLEVSLLTEAGEAMEAAVDSGDVAQEEGALNAQQKLIEKLDASPINGRVVIRLLPLDEFRGSQFDLELEDGDQLTISQIPSTVNVIGEVFNPVSLIYEEGLTVDDYLGKVGGMTKQADKKEVSVIRADGSVISRAQKKTQRDAWGAKKRIWHFGGFSNAKIGPGDTILVPRQFDKIHWMRETKDLSQIIFQLAVGAGVVLAL